jgi:hypothetical protein
LLRGIEFVGWMSSDTLGMKCGTSRGGVQIAGYGRGER